MFFGWVDRAEGKLPPGAGMAVFPVAVKEHILALATVAPHERGVLQVERRRSKSTTFLNIGLGLARCMVTRCFEKVAVHTHVLFSFARTSPTAAESDEGRVHEI